VAGVADLIAFELRDAGHVVQIARADRSDDAWHYDADIVGSDVRRGRWARSAVEFLKSQAPDLAERPTFLYATVLPGLRSTTPSKVRSLAFEIGTSLPRTFIAQRDGAVGPRDITRWARSINLALMSRVDGLPSGQWRAAEVELAS
jgi:hypothetical protein